ncbi:hypothetical protein BDN72DRAFT_962869 [Pluteus cervinus]|uniref:Uncharacterized protein n=1 Tax=Pluteus cervinus TaxID=181527 RepID=A0ACD3AH79_9AGAR|nr:hypothetical protein BDN72DRAFT_962869 [Pluteus cervinus]
MVSCAPHDKVEEEILDGYQQSYSIDDISKAEQVYDRVEGELCTDLPEDGPFAFVKKFFDQNQEIIETTAIGLASLTSEGKSIETAVNNFFRTAEVIIKGLDALAQIHPAIGVAVIAFKLVATFDMTRRENNAKVLALKAEMQNMMAVLFELRHFRDPTEAGPDGLPLGARIQTLMVKIANDIKNAGSACDAYLRKSFLARTLKSKIYESRLADFGAIFEGNKADLQRALSLHTARGVDAANEKLGSMENKVDQILQIFQQLNSPREKELQEFIEKNGGSKACIEDDALLEKLVSKGGETLTGVSGLVGRGDDRWNARQVLLKELQEDVGEMFKKNLVIFEKKLVIQLDQLEAIRKSTGDIVDMLSLHERVLDNDLRTIWKEMGWKGSVKARYFVLALHDYFSHQSSRSESNIPSETSTRVVASPTRSLITNHSPAWFDDKWTLSYVNVAHVQPILEAVDDDGSGFVSINEVNTFVASRPPEWTLLQWLAYWAAGWQISISSYKRKIYMQVRKIFSLLDRIIPANRIIVEAYLKSGPLIRLEHILRSTQAIETTQHHPSLVKLVDIFEEVEEERLGNNLASVAYDVDSVETVALVTGPGRIERYLLPLVHLLLKRDLGIIMLASKYVLGDEELSARSRSLDSVFRAVDERVERITGIFKQINADINARLGIFAFGMASLPIFRSFQNYYDKVYGVDQVHIIARAHNSFLKSSSDPFEDGDPNLQHTVDSTELKVTPIDLNALEKDSMDPPNPFQMGIYSTRVPSWFNRTANRHGADGQILGVGQTWSDSLTINGTLGEENNLRFYVEANDDPPLLCEGKFDPIRQRIEGWWTVSSESDSDTAPFNGGVHDQTILFLRTPSRLHRFLYSPNDFAKNPARARWTFACNAIMHEVRRKAWSWTHFKSRISEIKRFVELHIRWTLDMSEITPNNPLSDEEDHELVAIHRDFDVRAARLCKELTMFHIHRIMVDHKEFLCDSCQRSIYETRIICLVCLTRSFEENVNLCKACLTASVSWHDVIHNPTHSMIKYEHIVFDYDEVWSSRTIAGHVKTILKFLAGFVGLAIHIPSSAPLVKKQGFPLRYTMLTNSVTH